jgi:hypothetical protein
MTQDVLSNLRLARAALLDSQIKTRELSLALTKIDEGILWFCEHLRITFPVENMEKAPVSPPVEEKKSSCDITDEIITEMFGEPDPALGGYVLDRGNLRAFADRVLWAVVDSRKKQ